MIKRFFLEFLVKNINLCARCIYEKPIYTKYDLFLCVCSVSIIELHLPALICHYMDMNVSSSAKFSTPFKKKFSTLPLHETKPRKCMDKNIPSSANTRNLMIGEVYGVTN
jgi:hypothetical protein